MRILAKFAEGNEPGLPSGLGIGFEKLLDEFRVGIAVVGAIEPERGRIIAMPARKQMPKVAPGLEGVSAMQLITKGRFPFGKRPFVVLVGLHGLEPWTKGFRFV